MSKTNTQNSNRKSIASSTKKPASVRKDATSEVLKKRKDATKKVKEPKDETPKEIKKVTVTPKKTNVALGEKLRTTKSTIKNNISTNNRATRKPPETPPSSRVSNIKFFPTKEMYSNAIKREKSTLTKEKVQVAAPSTSITQIQKRTISKTPKNEPAKDDRPRTATLKRGSIVNSNIAGPDVPLSETPSLASLTSLEYDPAPPNNDADYEDDFDSYESDFENYQSSSSVSSTAVSLEEDDDVLSTSSSSMSLPKAPSSAGTDEERLDSGNYDLPEVNRHRQLLDNIAESHHEQQHHVEQKPSSSTLGSLSDEGFEDGKASVTSLQFVNFADAQKKQRRAKNFERQRKRGEHILNMIHLDAFDAGLLEMPSVPYADFIRTYGRSGTMQVSTQTGDDNTCEEVQTDKIELAERWTQCPVAFSKFDEMDDNFMRVYKQEFIGVGGLETSIDNNTNVKVNWTRLKNFLNAFEPQIVSILKESQQHFDTIETRNVSRDLPFSGEYIEFDTSSSILKDRPIAFVTFCSNTRVRFLTVHSKKESKSIDENSTSVDSVVCLWSLPDVKKPENVFTVTGEVTCCCLIAKYGEIVLGGLNNGSIAIWDKSKTYVDQQNLHKPTFLTEIVKSHTCKVISIHSLVELTDEALDWQQYRDKIFSLDEDGTLILWSLSTRNDNDPLRRIVLLKTSTYSPEALNPDLKDLQCIDTTVSVDNPNHVFVATNYGFVLHCLLSGGKINPKRYNPGKTNQSNCIEFCPFSQFYFLAGYEDGSVILYSCLLERPLKVLINRESEKIPSGIQSVQWSRQRPCVFFAKDRNDTLHVWDLSISDMYPTYSVNLVDKISCMKLSPIYTKSSESACLMLSSETGNIKLHVFNAEYAPISLTQHSQEVKNFLNFVNRLCYV